MKLDAKWAAGIGLTVLIGFLGWLGTTAHVNAVDVGKLETKVHVWHFPSEPPPDIVLTSFHANSSDPCEYQQKAIAAALDALERGDVRRAIQILESAQ